MGDPPYIPEISHQVGFIKRHWQWGYLRRRWLVVNLPSTRSEPPDVRPGYGVEPIAIVGSKVVDNNAQEGAKIVFEDGPFG